MNPPEPRLLLEERSPNGNIVAFVEDDGKTCYFYLNGEQSTNFGVKSCWVRNLGPAPPEELDKSAMANGIPPLLPRRYCKHPCGAAPLDSGSLSLVWAEEGDAAALQENGEIIAIIPSWSERGQFHGYARDCIGESPLCWELKAETNVQIARYRKAAECWKAWAAGKVWADFQKTMMQAIEQRFGRHSNYYAIDEEKWPPKALLRIHTADAVLLITVGMALRPQPKVELYYEDPSPYRRIELALTLNPSLPDDDIQSIAEYVSAQSGYPWHAYTFLGNGHSIRSDEFKTISRQRLEFALLQSLPERTDGLDFPPFRGDPITLLWMTPISVREQLFAAEMGSSKVAEALRKAGYDWAYNFQREELRLTF